MSMKAIEHLSEATTTSHARGSSKRSERSPTNCPAVRVATCRSMGDSVDGWGRREMMVDGWGRRGDAGEKGGDASRA